MPFIDFEIADPQSTKYDAIVVGCGAAGIFVASELIKQGRTTIIVESGGECELDEYQNLNMIEETAKKQSNPIWNRKRMLGGTTTAWGGQSLPFTPLDFSSRSWMHSEWPISFSDIEEHYIKANQFMGIDSCNYDSDISNLTRVFSPGFSENKIHFHFSKWAPQPNFLILKKSLLSHYCDILYHAQSVKFNWADNQNVEGIDVASINGKRLQLFADAIFVATGGIEATRMLLLSKEDPASPLARLPRWLGQGYMDHPSIQVGEIAANSPFQLFKLQKQFGTQLYKRQKYSVRLSASSHWQKTRKLSNISAHFLFLPHPSEDWLANTRRAFKQPNPPNLWHFIRTFHLAILGAFVLFTQKIIFRSNSKTVMCVMAEQPATSSSYITLSQSLDRFGLKRACIHWKIDPIVGKTISSFSRDLKSELERLKICRVNLDPILSQGGEALLEKTCDVNHHMGGAPMSSSPDTGVVDQWMRPWGLSNLFICSAAVFPTSSHSNPTLTLLALCSRLMNRLSSVKKFKLLSSEDF